VSGVRATGTSRTARTSSVEAESRALGLNTGWTVFSYMLSGMAAYGGIGWLVGRAVHIQMLFPIGMLVGLAISVGFVIWRFGRNGSTDRDTNMDTDTETGMSATSSRSASHRRGIPREERSR
jgi:hypothetical protein